MCVLVSLFLSCAFVWAWASAHRKLKLEHTKKWLIKNKQNKQKYWTNGMRPTHIHKQTHMHKQKRYSGSRLFVDLFGMGFFLLFVRFRCATHRFVFALIYVYFSVVFRQSFNDWTSVNDIDFTLNVLSDAHEKLLKNRWAEFNATESSPMKYI